MYESASQRFELRGTPAAVSAIPERSPRVAPRSALLSQPRCRELKRWLIGAHAPVHLVGQLLRYARDGLKLRDLLLGHGAPAGA